MPFLILCACDRGCGTPDKPPAPVAEAGVVDVAVTQAPSRVDAAPVAIADAGSLSADAGVALLPNVEHLALTKCPARMAVVKLETGSVELFGCPASDDKAGPGKALLKLLDAAGKTKQEIPLNDDEAHSEKLEVKDLYGTGRPVFFVTVTEPSMGSWGGPRTSLYEIEGERLVPVGTAAKDGGIEPLTLTSALNVTWWLHPARSKKGDDIYEIATSADGKSTGHRFAFENGKWVDHAGPLKNWTGEHLKDTEAEFP